MKYTDSRFQQRTSSFDLAFYFGISIIMHALILLVDPLANINMDDRWNDQIQGPITVYLREGMEEGNPNGAHLSNPAAVKKVSPEAGKIRQNKAAALKPAKLLKPADKPVVALKSPQADSPPISRVQKAVPPPEAPPLKAEPPRNAEEVLPAPVEKKAPVPDLPPKVASPEPVIEPAPKMAINKSPTPAIAESEAPKASSASTDNPVEPESKITEPPKPMAVPIKPVDQPIDTEDVQALTALPKKGKAKEEGVEQTSKPALQEVKEKVKREPLPTPPVAVKPAPPEEKQEAPVKPEPVKVEERPVELPVKPEPVQVQERPVEAPVKPEPVQVRERPVEPPVKPEPIKVKERPVEPPVKKIIEPVKPETPPPAPVEIAPAASEEKREAPVVQKLAKAEEQPVISLKPQEALIDTPLPATTKKETVKEEVKDLPLKQVREMPPVTPGPLVDKKDEKVKGEVGAANEKVIPPRVQPITPAPVIGKTANKTAETPIKVAGPKAGAQVKKKTIFLYMLKRLGSEADPVGIGIPISRPKVKITTPAAKMVKNRVQEISGQVNGNGITRVILILNDDSVTVPVEHDAFHWEGALKEGKNTISATVWDRNRYSATDKIIVESIPAKNGFSLSIDEPGAGEVESPVITVKGKVGDSSVDTVKLILNKAAIEVAVQDGGFEKTVLFREGENALQAEAVNATGASARSDMLNITVKNRKTPDILVHLIWNDPGSELKATVARKDREGLDQENAAVSDIDVVEKMSAREGYRERVFAVYGAKAGAHVISVSGGKKTKCLVIVTLPAKQKTRLFGPVLIGEEGTMIGRLLMPEGIYWDEDEWFTGKIENGDSITKYNSPEGMSWKEIK